jgi:hypothetical protein
VALCLSFRAASLASCVLCCKAPCWGALRVRRAQQPFRVSFEGGYIEYPPSLPQQGGQKPNMRSGTTHPFNLPPPTRCRGGELAPLLGFCLRQKPTSSAERSSRVCPEPLPFRVSPTGSLRLTTEIRRDFDPSSHLWVCFTYRRPHFVFTASRRLCMPNGVFTT